MGRNMATLSLSTHFKAVFDICSRPAFGNLHYEKNGKTQFRFCRRFLRMLRFVGGGSLLQSGLEGSAEGRFGRDCGEFGGKGDYRPRRCEAARRRLFRLRAA